MSWKWILAFVGFMCVFIGIMRGAHKIRMPLETETEEDFLEAAKDDFLAKNIPMG